MLAQMDATELGPAQAPVDLDPLSDLPPLARNEEVVYTTRTTHLADETAAFVQSQREYDGDADRC